MDNEVIHPLREHRSHSYPQICRKIENFYGVHDAERFFFQRKREIHDKVLPDEFGFSQFDSLRELWEHRQRIAKWTDEMTEEELIEPSGKRGAVEIYSVRGPGSAGELGVLTTEHDIERYLSGLAAALAKYLTGQKQMSEEELGVKLHWVLKNGIPIAFKLAGYRADTVVERHVLMSGSSMPNDQDVVSSSL